MTEGEDAMRETTHDLVDKGRVITGLYATARGDRYGVTFVKAPSGTLLKVLASDGSPEVPWEHVSVSTPARCPTWDEMCFVKGLFWTPEEAVMQLHPPQSEYVNNHPFCLHLWRPWHQPIPLPPSIAVGIKEAVA